MIPVEDFTGPTISEIKKFIGIIDEARRNGEVRFYWKKLFVCCHLFQVVLFINFCHDKHAK
jgi:protein-tyrosine phosphatase